MDYKMECETGEYKLKGSNIKLIKESRKQFLKRNPRIFYWTLFLNIFILVVTSFLVGPVIGFIVGLTLVVLSFYVFPPAVIREINVEREIR